MKQKKDIISLYYDELCDFITRDLGQPKFRAKQIAGYINKGIPFDMMSTIPKNLRVELSEKAIMLYPDIEQKMVSAIDGTVKYLFRLHDGELIEGVVMKYEHGYSMCVSSEAGCSMGCKFCASTIGGKIRNLFPSEILGQIIMAQKDLSIRISNIVMMGIGEPLDNYDNVIRFLRIVSSPESLGIGLRHISISTCGLVDKIYLLAKEQLPITLSISLHACDDNTRSSIMPVNRLWNIDALLTACRDYFDATGRRISFEYTLIAGKNDSVEQACELAALLKKYLENRPFHVNLIPVNPVRERSFAKSDKNAVNAFCRKLCDKGINATVRRRLGADIDASCGQLRHKYSDNSVPDS